MCVHRCCVISWTVGCLFVEDEMEVWACRERFLELLGSGTLKAEAGNAFFSVVVGLVSRRVLLFHANKLCV